MARNAEATISVRALTTQARAALSDLSTSMSGVSSKASKMGAAVMAGVKYGAAAAGAAVGAATVKAIRDASDLAETVNKSNVIFGKNAAAMDAWASGAASSAGLSKQAALDAAAGFGDMFSQIGFSAKAAADMSRSTVQMAADFGSFNNLPTADVADRISAAYRGEYDSLQALVPNINAARVEQEAMALAHKKSAKELTAQEKALAVNAILQKDGARAVGDFARTSDGAANKQKILQARVENVSARLGQALLPAWDKVLGATERFVGFVETKVVPAFQKFAAAEGTKNALKSIGDFLTTNLPPAFEAAKSAVSTFFAVLQNPAFQAFAASILTVVAGVKGYLMVMNAIKVATMAWKVAQIALNIALSANPIGLIVLAIAALAVGIYVAYKRSATFRAIVHAVGQALLTAGKKAVEFVKTAVKWIGDLPGKIKAAFNKANSLLYNTGRDVILGFWNGLKGKFNEAKDWLLEKVNGLPAAAKKLLGISSPSKVFKWIAERVPEGWSIGLQKGWARYGKPAAKKLVASMAGDLAAKAKAITDARKQALADLVAARTDYGKSIAENVAGGGITQLANLDGVTPTAQADVLRKALSTRLGAIRKYRSDLTALTKAGAGNALLSQLIDGGIDQGGALAASLRAAGPAVVKQIAALNAQVQREANLAGVNLAGQIYNGRVAAATRVAAQPVVLRIDSSGRPVDQVLVDLLRKAIRAKGGNVQVVLGARG